MAGTGGPQPTPFEPELVQAEPVTSAVVRGQVRLEDLRQFFDASFGQLGRAVSDQGLAVLGPAFGLYRGPLAETIELEVGFPVGGAVRPDGDVVPSQLPDGPVARVTHYGGFDGLGESWSRLAAWVRDQGLSPSTVRWESYVTQPSPEMDPADLRTELNWPVAARA